MGCIACSSDFWEPKYNTPTGPFFFPYCQAYASLLRPFRTSPDFVIFQEWGHDPHFVSESICNGHMCIFLYTWGTYLLTICLRSVFSHAFRNARRSFSRTTKESENTVKKTNFKMAPGERRKKPFWVLMYLFFIFLWNDIILICEFCTGVNITGVICIYTSCWCKSASLGFDFRRRSIRLVLISGNLLYFGAQQLFKNIMGWISCFFPCVDATYLFLTFSFLSS